VETNGDVLSAIAISSSAMIHFIDTSSFLVRVRHGSV